MAAFERKRTFFYSDYELYIILSTCVSHSIGLFYDIYNHTKYNLVFNVGRLWSYYAEPRILLTDIDFYSSCLVVVSAR